MLESNLYYLLKFAVPIMLFVVVELVPLRGGNEFEARLYNKILVPFRGVLEIFRRALPSLFYGSTPRGIYHILLGMTRQSPKHMGITRSLNHCLC